MTSDTATTVFIYDGQTLRGFVERCPGGWRAVANRVEIGIYQTRDKAHAAVTAAIDGSQR